jgi:hypothetical protein
MKWDCILQFNYFVQHILIKHLHHTHCSSAISRYCAISCNVAHYEWETEDIQNGKKVSFNMGMLLKGCSIQSPQSHGDVPMLVSILQMRVLGLRDHKQQSQDENPNLTPPLLVPSGQQGREWVSHSGRTGSGHVTDTHLLCCNSSK